MVFLNQISAEFSTQIEILLAIICAAIATWLTRVLPIFLFEHSNLLSKKENINTNSSIAKLFKVIEKYMGFMIIIILICYCLKDINLYKFPYGVPEFLGILITIFLHYKYKNLLVSICVATGIYIFTNRVFL